MNNINNDSAALFNQINQQNQSQSTQSTTQNDDSELFTQLLIAQLQNQDPTSPADTNSFLQQIASMQSVESINNLNSSVSDLANSLLSSQSALQASSLVGQNVFVKTDTAAVNNANQDIRGIVEVPTSTADLRIRIFNSAGAEVETLNLGQQTAGDLNFTWNAGDSPLGDYRLVAEVQTSDGYQPVNSYLGYNVNSVTLGQNGVGMTINTDAGSLSYSDIKQIG